MFNHRQRSDSHVTDPRAVLAEARRVLRPGGTLAVFDGDFASWAFEHPDAELAAAMEGALRDVSAEQPRVMRALPRLLSEAGLRLVAVQAHVYSEIGAPSEFLFDVARFDRRLSATTGRMPGASVETWLDGLRTAAADETFFAACNYYAYIARRVA